MTFPTSSVNLLYIVPLSSTFWGSLLFLANRSPYLHGRTFKFRNLVVALAHDTLAVLVSLGVLLTEPYSLGAPNTNFSLFALNTSLGYFLVDMCAYVNHGVKSNEYDFKQLFHHTCCVVGSYTCLISGRAAYDLNLGLFLSHLASPPGYLRFMSKELGMKDTDMSKALRRSYVATKTFAIGVLSPPVVLDIIRSTSTPVFIKLTAVGILLVNLCWLLHIL